MFFSSFFLNFFFSFAFLVLNSCLSVQLHNKYRSKFNLFVNEFNIFIILVSFYYLIINISNLFKLNFISEYIIYIIIFIKVILTLKFQKYLQYKDIYFFFKKIGKYNIFIILFFLLSILPLSDADSIATHLFVAKNFNNYGSLNFDENFNIEGMLYFGNEILLQLSFIFKSDNFGSQLNFFSLLLFLYTYKKNEDFRIIIFSIPLIIFFISTQKLQLFFGLIFLSIFILSKENLLKNKIDFFIFSYLLLFFCSGKINYIIFGLIIYIFLCLKSKRYFKLITSFSLINFVLFLLPILVIKFINIGNPISPFFDEFFYNRENFKAFEVSLRSSEGWYSSINIRDILKPFFPLDLYTLSSGFGLIFLLLLFDIKNYKTVHYIPYIIIFSVLAIGQLLPRYYLEAFLLFAYFSRSRNIVRYLCYFQSSVIFCFGSVFLIFAYYEIVQNKFMKNNFQSKFSYSYYNSQKLKNINYKVLGLNLDRGSIYFNNNIYSMRLVNSLNLIKNKKNSVIINFLEKNQIDYLIHDKNNSFVIKCIKTVKVDEIYTKVAIRNFLKNEKPKKKIISKILNISDECRK